MSETIIEVLKSIATGLASFVLVGVIFGSSLAFSAYASPLLKTIVGYGFMGLVFLFFAFVFGWFLRGPHV